MDGIVKQAHRLEGHTLDHQNRIRQGLWRETVEQRDRIMAQHRGFSALNMFTYPLEELTK